MTQSVTFEPIGQYGLRYDIPDDPIPADLGNGPATTVHLLPNATACERVVFIASDWPIDDADEGYWIEIQRLRDEDDWVRHLSEKETEPGHRSGAAMLAEAIARKKDQMQGR